MKKIEAIVALCAWILSAGVATAADPVLSCEAAKLKLTGGYAACRLKAEATAVKKGGAPDFSKCAAKFNDKFPAAEDKAAPAVCPSQGDASEVKAFVDACDDAIADQLAGGSLPLIGCGDGIAQAVESCDGTDLHGKTCASFGASNSPGLACSSECTLDFSGCSYSTVPVRFIDNGDGTATDLWTGRIWEKKTGTPTGFNLCPDLATCPDPHDVNNDYRWTATNVDFDGPAKTIFLDVLNDVAGGGASCFAGHCDWRLPTVLELKGIVLEPEAVGTCGTSPCIDASFPGPTGVGGYWTANTYTDSTMSAFYTRFDAGGGSFPALKTANRFVRAVRGGL